MATMDSLEVEQPRASGASRRSSARSSVVDVVGLGSYVQVETKGLSICQATTVSFNSALGATIGLVAYFPKECGYVGFLVLLLAVAVTAILMQQVLMKASAELSATTFEELCRPLPQLPRVITVWSGLIYLWACGAFFFQFIEVFVSDQICPVLCQNNTGTWLCQSELRVALLVFLATFPLCFPAQLSGMLPLVINNTNLVTKYTVIAIALAKGVKTMLQDDPLKTSWTAWRPSGFMGITSLLLGSFANTGIMPQITSDVSAPLRLRAAQVCPLGAVFMQSVVCVLLAMAGYFALGNVVEADAFQVYHDLYPDWMTTVLQGGMALLTCLSSPLVMLPCKSQVWGFLSAESLGDASLAARIGVTVFITLPAAVVPCLLGFKTFANLVLALSCTCGVWMNLLLPALVLIYCKIVPSRQKQEPHKGSLVLVTWILLLGALCMFDGLLRMSNMTRAVEKTPLAQQCRDAARAKT
ncbi:unnamed protein product, partial [Effrenium voratum]